MCLPPTPRYALIVSLGLLAKDDLGHNAITEQDENHGAEEFRKGIAAVLPNSTPKELILGFGNLGRWDRMSGPNVFLVRSCGHFCLVGRSFVDDREGLRRGVLTDNDGH